MRLYNPALGRFISVDPLSRKYPFYSPAKQNGVKNIEVNGLVIDPNVQAKTIFQEAGYSTSVTIESGNYNLKRTKTIEE